MAAQKRRMLVNGCVLYDGPSLLEHGGRVVVVATGLTRPTTNAKTGDMIQTWILPADRPPFIENCGSVCGSCEFAKYRICYVNRVTVFNVWKLWKAGVYPVKHLSVLRGRLVRIGTFGDPAAVDAEFWNDVTKVCAGWTAYTRYWAEYPELKSIAMASVYTMDQYVEAHKRGWHTYRIVPPADMMVDDKFGTSKRMPGERWCPASKSRRVQCSRCLLCNGQCDVAIVLHGNPVNIVGYRRLVKAQ